MALRLIFEAEGKEVRLVRKQRIQTPAPAQATAVDSQHEGIYAELRNERGETLYQQVVSSQIESTVEVFSPDKSVHRIEAPDQKRTIVLTIPDEPEARSVVFLRGGSFSRGRLRTQTVSAPEELARFDLVDDERKP